MNLILFMYVTQAVMLKVIHNRLKPQAENIIAKEQAGFQERRSTTEKKINNNSLRKVLATSTFYWLIEFEGL